MVTPNGKKFKRVQLTSDQAFVQFFLNFKQQTLLLSKRMPNYEFAKNS